MSISVTENREKTFNPIRPLVYGAGAGVVARSLMPITDVEKETLSQVSVDKRLVVKGKVEQTLAELRELLKSAPEEEKPGYDLYFKYSDSGLDKAARPEIEKQAAALPEVAQKKFFEIKKHVDKVVSDTKSAHDYISRAVIKESRSLFNFVSVGALAAVGCAFVGHVLSKMAASEPSVEPTPTPFFDKVV